jgi:hypothetical protein
MSLVRLLTAGKSLVGIQDSKSRYRSVDPRAMPKFGSEKKSNTDVARESEAQPSIAKSNVESSKANVEKMPVAITRKARGSGWVSQWGSKLSSLVSQKPKPARSAIPRPNGVPVQGELSLDNIRVVRNDLSDADLEVVTRKMGPEKSVTPAFASANPADGNAGVTVPEGMPAMLSVANP